MVPDLVTALMLHLQSQIALHQNGEKRLPVIAQLHPKKLQKSQYLLPAMAELPNPKPLLNTEPSIVKLFKRGSKTTKMIARYCKGYIW